MGRKVNEILKEWCINYVRSRDAHAMKIRDIEIKGNILIIKEGKSKSYYIIALDLKSITPRENTTIVTLNNTKNIEIITKKWDDLSRIRRLKIILANPLSEQEQSWSIKPHIHEKVCDRKSLKRGLKSMAELVAPITEEELRDYHCS
jgi:hypothetical protein